MAWFHLIICLLLSPLCCGVCQAAHPLITDDAATVGRGNTQIEVNGEYERLRDHGTKERTTALGSTVTHGLTDAADTVVSAPYLFTQATESGESEREHGLGDIVVEFKWRFYEKNGLSMALKPGLVLPTGDDDEGLGAGKVGYELFFIATKEMKPFVFHANAGYMRNENAVDEREDLWHLSVAGELPVAEALTLVANVGVERDSDPSLSREQVFVLGGLIWELSKFLSLDGGLKYSAANGSAHGWSLLAGLTFQL